MAKNNANLTLEERLMKKIQDMERELRDLKTNQLKRLVVPSYNGTPTGVKNGEIWYDTSTSKVKKRENNTTKDINAA